MPQTKPDFTTKTTMHEAKAACCPYCHRPLRDSQRLSYPPQAVGAFASVYRCACGKHIGAPVGRE